MVLTVLENAYLRKAEQHPNFSETHKKILFLLNHEEKHFTKDELFYTIGISERLLEKILTDLEELNIVHIEGWLVKLKEYENIF